MKVKIQKFKSNIEFWAEMHGKDYIFDLETDTFIPS